MAERRMFAKTIVESDAFLSQSIKAQNLYYQLNMKADDDGMLNNANTICRSLGFKSDVLKELIKNRFLLDLGDGITVIKHWLINNRIQKDRYKPTVYQEKYKLLSIKEDKGYTLLDSNWTTDGQHLDTQDRLGKDSIGYLDDDIKICNQRLLEAGVEKSIIDNAIHYYTTINCPHTKDFYLKVLDIVQDNGVLNKYAYISKVAQNEQS